MWLYRLQQKAAAPEVPALGSLGSRLDLLGIGVDQRRGHRRWFVTVRTDFADRRHLGGGSGNETFVEFAEFGRQDSPFDHFKPALASEIDDRRPSDAGKEAIVLSLTAASF